MLNTPGKRFRKRNLIISLSTIGILFLLYICAASLATESDNVGVIVVPPVLLTIFLPFISILCGIIETFTASDSSLGLKERFKYFLSTQPIIVLMVMPSGILIFICLLLAIMGQF